MCVTFHEVALKQEQWLVANALAEGYDPLLSIGDIQSHHTRQATAVAA